MINTSILSPTQRQQSVDRELCFVVISLNVGCFRPITGTNHDRKNLFVIKIAIKYSGQKMGFVEVKFVCVCVHACVRCIGIQFFYPLCSNLHKRTAENFRYEFMLLPWCILRSNYLVERKENREECLTLVLTHIQKKKAHSIFWLVLL